MKKRRVKFTIEFEADLDMVPGWGHQPIDWITMAGEVFAFAMSTYRTTAKMVGDTVEVDGYRTTNLGSSALYESYDPKMTPENMAHDVDVYHWLDRNPGWDIEREPLPRLWIVQFADESIEAFKTEDSARERQRQWRRSIGRDNTTGENQP